MTKTVTELKVRNYVLDELENATKYPDNALGYRTMAYGAVFFASNYLFDKYNQELADWWDKEVLPLFNALIRGR